MHFILRHFFLLLFVVLLISCEGSRRENNSLTTAAESTPYTSVDTSGALTESQRQGNYRTGPVTELSEQAGGISCSIYNMNINGEQITIQQNIFDDHACNGSLLGEIKTIGTMKEMGLLPSDPSTHMIDITLVSSSIIVHSNMWPQFFSNQNSRECNIESMPLEVEFSVNGRNCNFIGRFPQPGSIFASTYKLDGSDILTTYHAYELTENIGVESIPAPRAITLKVRYHKAD